MPLFSGDYRDKQDIDFDSTTKSSMVYGTRRFKVDLSNGGWEELETLGDNALFLGSNASISVRASKFKGISASKLSWCHEECAFQSDY